MKEKLTNLVFGKKPPNWDILEKKFGVKWELTAVAYGNNIYAEKSIPEEIIVHELTHVKQQGKNPKRWWDKYIKDPKFRSEQELEAHKVQLNYIKKLTKDRNSIVKSRTVLAKRCSSTMYGECISFAEAYKYLQ